MINNTRRSRTAGVAAACALAAAVALSAQGPGDRRLADVQVTSAGIDFVSQVEHGGAILRVSGTEAEYRFTFGPGESPFLSAFDAKGEPLADGVYGWELELLPVAGDRADLMRAASENGGQAPQALPLQSGAFTIAGGYVVDPDEREADASRVSEASGQAVHHDEAAAPSERRPALDDDAAVAAGAVETRTPAAPVVRAEGADARPISLDSDESVAAGLSSERHDGTNSQ